MVAPYADGRVSRSMVRVPGSGGNDDVDPICLNLGKVSNAAAAIPVPKTLSIGNRNERRQLNSFGFRSQFNSFELTLQTGDEKQRPSGGVMLGGSAQSEGLTDSLRPAPPPPSGSNASTVASTGGIGITGAVRETSAAANNVQVSSRLKRQRSEAGAKEITNNQSCKRQRGVSASMSGHVNHNSSPRPTVSQDNGQMRWVLPNGILAANGNPQSLPIIFPVGSNTSNIPIAMPVGMLQVNNEGSSPLVVPSGSSGMPPLVLPSGSFGMSPQVVPSGSSGIESPQVMPNGSSGIPPQINLVQNQQGSFVMVPAQAIPVLIAAVPKQDLELVQERERLRRENRLLKYRLSMFHQLLRNKERLMTVLNRLETVGA